MRKIRIKRKKASIFLSEETVKVVLAVICIGLLVFLGYKLYTLFMKKSSIEIARENLNQLIIKINSLNNSESKKFTLSGPNDWYLMLFNKGDPMPGECRYAKNCLCICETQTYVGCDQQGTCKPIEIDSEMSYSCFTSNIAGLAYQHKCLKIQIKDIDLTKNEGILFIGLKEGYSIGERFFEVFKLKDTETEMSIEDLVFRRISQRDEATFLRTKRLITSYLRENVTEISDWSIEVNLNGEIVAAFIEATPPSYYMDGPFIPTFKNSFEKEIERDGQKYLVKFQFNLKN